jgi:hypothetical protein
MVVLSIVLKLVCYLRVRRADGFPTVERRTKSECEIHINLMYFGGNDKNLLRLNCSKFSKGAETALKSTYRARSSKVVFTHDGASMPATGIVFRGGYYSLSQKIEFENF